MGNFLRGGERANVLLGAAVVAGLALAACTSDGDNATQECPTEAMGTYKAGDSISYAPGYFRGIADTETGSRHEDITAPVLDGGYTEPVSFSGVSAEGDDFITFVAETNPEGGILSAGDSMIVLNPDSSTNGADLGVMDLAVDGEFDWENNRTKILENAVSGTLVGLDVDCVGFEVRLPDGSSVIVGEGHPVNVYGDEPEASE